MKINNSHIEDSVMDGFARRVIRELDSPEAALPHDISERLRVARLQAVERRARSTELAPAKSSSPLTAPRGSLAYAGAGAGSAGSTCNSGWLGGSDDSGNSGDSGFSRIFQMFTSALPIIALVAGLLTIAAVQDDSRAQEVADVDTALLTDNLPLEAYADPGFAQFLKTDVSTPSER